MSATLSVMDESEVFDEKDIRWTIRLIRSAQIGFLLVAAYSAFLFISSLNPFLSGALIYFGTMSMVSIFLLATVDKALNHHTPYAWNLSLFATVILLFSPLLPLAILSLRQLSNKEARIKFHYHKTAYSDAKMKAPQKISLAIFASICCLGSFFYYDFQKDSTYFDVAFRRSSYKLPPNLSVRELYAIGADCNTYGKTECSIAAFLGILKRRPGDQRALANLAMAQSHIGQHIFAVSNFRKIEDEDFQNFDLYLHYGNSLKSMGHEEQAILSYRKAISKNPYLIDAAAKITLILISKGQFAEALSFIEEYLEKNPNAQRRLRTIRKELQEKVKEA